MIFWWKIIIALVWFFFKKMFEFSIAIPSYEHATDAICLCLFMYTYAKKKKDGEKYLDAGSWPPWAMLML